MNISQVIRERRLRAGLTQEQVAKRLGVSTPAVNKWERGVSYPDITLIPALARLLECDANTLLSFEENLSSEKNHEIQREVERLVREEGYDAGFSYAQGQMQTYPSSDELAIVLTSFLDGALMLYQIPDPERYRCELESSYERLSRSSVSAVRDQALSMLVAKAMACDDFDRAQELLDHIPTPAIDKRQQQAALSMRQQDYERAGKLLEAQVTKAAGDCIAALASLSEIALRTGEVDTAEDIARRARLIVQACDLPSWMAATLELGVAVARRDSDAAMSLLEEIVASMAAVSSERVDSPLHRYVGLTDISYMSQQMLTLVLDEVKTDESYAFLWKDPSTARRLEALLAERMQ